ncbi:LysR family transcriptional regulator [bacterium 3DAC]|nr:LysR family transcriptional regulator [bacterium 3DAC]
MELTWIKYFVELAHEGHMTRTAEKLGVSQPNLSMVIKRLEQELGVPLFDRVGRRITLSDYGKAFLPYATKTLSAIESGKRAVLEVKGIYDRNITLATTGTTFLFGLLKDFIKQYPDVRVRQFIVSPEEASSMLKMGKADFAITSPPLSEEELCTTLIYEDKILLATSRDHHLSREESIDLRDLKDEPFIDLVENYTFRKLTDEMCQLAGFTPNIVFEGEIVLMAELVEEGLGVALIPESIMRLYPDFPVKVIPIRYPEYTRKVGLSWYKHSHMGKYKEAFREFVEAYYK